MHLITSQAVKITFVETEITFKVAYIRVLVANITIVVVEIIFKEDVITSLVVKSTYSG